jgi:predicted short-subunit dehydrogenase-like oxidoreductase (DUF2520 family)
MENALKLSFIGNGNLAYQLVHAFHHAGQNEIDIFAKDRAKSESLFNHLNVCFVDQINQLKGDLYFICTNDEAIEDVAMTLPQDAILIHCSGSTSLNAIASKRRGVIYPIQTLNKSKPLDFSTIPLCITSDLEDVSDLLLQLASKISNNVKLVSDEERLHLHCAAVMMNNFVNHLAKKTHQFVEEKGINYEILIPIINRTFAKITELPLDFHQTGPAKRNDQTTMEKHFSLLENDPDLLAIYKTISKSIFTYENSQGS